MTLASQRLGQQGENRAAQYYERLGGTVLARNVRSRFGEIDLIVEIGPTQVVFVEVKTRSTEYFGGAESVTPRKLARIRRMAGQWLQENAAKFYQIRIDVVEILGDQITVYKGVEDGAW